MNAVALVTSNEFPNATEDDRLLLAPLNERGISVTPVVWTDSLVRWKEFDRVVLRSTWDYHLHPESFSGWIDHMEREGITLWNPPSVVRWNMDKRYLRDLQEKGVPIPRTIWLEQGRSCNLSSLLHANNLTQAVVKPAISATAYRTWITSPDRAGSDQPALDMMLKSGGVVIQEFLTQIQTVGEWSFIFFRKRFSHAVLKRVKQGDFRVQHEFGGYVEQRMPPRALIRQAERVMDSVAAPLLYARVDGIDVAGTLLLMELELIEPALFFSTDRDAPERFVESLMATSD